MQSTRLRFGGPDRSLNHHKVCFRDFAANIVLDSTIKVIEDQGGIPTIPIPLPPTEQGPITRDPEPIPSIGKIGIIGAGTAGLYAAMILQDLGIDYEILEASDRIGGRIFTHRFNKDAFDVPVNEPARYDYVDIGAMRYPRIPFMDRVFDLFKRIQLDKENLLIEYKLSAPNNLKYFNTRPPLNSTATHTTNEDDYFHVSERNKGTVPNVFVDNGAVDDYTSAVYQYYKDLFGEMDDVEDDLERRAAFQRAWGVLTTQDHFSTRGYMLAGKEGKPPSAPAPYPEPVVEWLETYDSATGLYDEAFVESVIDSLDFDWPQPLTSSQPAKKPNPPTSPAEKERAKRGKKVEEVEWEWVCIDGGSDHMTHNMEALLNKKPILNKQVNCITLSPNKDHLIVSCADGDYNYSQVINTAPLGCIGAMDLDGCELLYNQKLAIRSLQYDASTKVAIKFEKRWWEDPVIMKDAPIKGGQSSTDLPIRVCVYPSYGLGVPPQTPPPGVLLASYTWAQDARRLGSLAQGKGTVSDAELLELTLKNLEKLHGISRDQMGPVIDHYAHSWYNDRYTRGAFALFGPGQFGRQSEATSLFAALKAPGANGKLHFAGEATSVHHAWVLGALNSAWRAVYNALDGRPKDRLTLIRRWGIPDEESEVNLQKLAIYARYHLL